MTKYPFVPGHEVAGTVVAVGDHVEKVKVGQRVTWTNKQQGVPHTVTADGGAFDHPMPSGATFSFTLPAVTEGSGA